MTDAVTQRTDRPDPTDAPGPPSTVRPSPPPLSTTTFVLGGGHLSWLGWTWAVTAVIFVIVMFLIVRLGGHLDSSLWQSAGAAWQRYVIFAAGVTTIPSFLSMFVANGVTRSQLAASNTLAMVAVALCGATFVLVGFLVEGLLFGSAGWDHTMNDGAPMVSGGELAITVLRFTALFCLWFSAGWLIGTGFYRFGFFGGVALIGPSALPVALGELLIGQDAASINIDVVTGLVDTPVLIGLLVGVGLIAMNATIARALTRTTPVRSC